VGRVVVGTPGDASPEPSDTFASLADCVGKPVTGRAVVAAARGPGLIDQKGPAEITSNVDIVQTNEMAQADRAVVQDPVFPECVAQLAGQRAVNANAGVNSVDARRTRIKRYGDYSTAIVVQVDATSNGQPTP